VDALKRKLDVSYLIRKPLEEPLTSPTETINFVHAGICPYFKATTHEEAYGSCGGASEEQPSSEQENANISTPSSTRSWWWQGPKATSFAPIRGGYWPKPSAGANQDGKFGPRTTSVQSIWEKSCDGPTTFVQGTRTYTATKATVLTISDSPITWTKDVATGTWAELIHNNAATTTVDAAQGVETNTAIAQTNTANHDVAEMTSNSEPLGAPVAGARASSTNFPIAPAQFTGAASNSKAYMGAAAVVAIGAAVAI
jgi:hypothetical protein